MPRRVGLCLLALAIAAVFPLAIIATGTFPSDPGVRDGAAGAGGPIAGLTSTQRAFFLAGQDAFQDVASVRGTEPGAPDAGLGPRFNMNQCAGCHLQPAVGGSSPAVNPQVAVATRYGAHNSIPYFVAPNGPVREARFKYYYPGGPRDGSVHELYVITGRYDARGCYIAQPDFRAASAADNISLRIPTPMFGSGLIEEIQESEILANAKSNRALKQSLGISGHENRIGEDGRLSRFGWKAQITSVQVFGARAYNAEMGVTNELSQAEMDDTPGCLFNGTPEDQTNFDAAQPLNVASDAVLFGQFMRFLAPPQPAAPTYSTRAGSTLFGAVGCSLCHTPSLKTGLSSVAALSYQTASLYSDLLVHNMGTGLADDIVQGYAGPDEFRTPPLWGLGQRIFFLHDGRTTDLLKAIAAHSSPGSEASAVVARFNALTPMQKQDVLNFLRSL